MFCNYLCIFLNFVEVLLISVLFISLTLKFILQAYFGLIFHNESYFCKKDSIRHNTIYPKDSFFPQFLQFFDTQRHRNVFVYFQLTFSILLICLLGDAAFSVMRFWCINCTSSSMYVMMHYFKLQQLRTKILINQILLI